MTAPRPKFITFDCYGTLINFEMTPAARRVYADRLSPEAMDGFCADFSAFRLDEVLGPWKPYSEVVHNAVERACKLWKMAFDPAHAQRIFDEIPGWMPHPDVRAGLAKVAREIPLPIKKKRIIRLTASAPKSAENVVYPFSRI